MGLLAPKWCRLIIYMAATDTTTIRVPTETRDRLNSLATRRGEPAGEVVAKLVSAADADAMLAEASAGFEKIAADPEVLSVYRAESEELESGFEAPAPEW
jgi:predicted transcriptional regulator